MLSSAIQNYIISQLKNADVSRYRDLRPAEVPNDLFNYHLKALIGHHLVDKHSGGYSLSAEGQAYVADVHHTSDEANRLFKFNVITIVSRVQNGELQILTQRRHSQPSFGIIGVMGGTIVKGESLEEGASRKLQQETGLSAAFRLIGIERRRLYKQGQLFSDVLFPICYSTHGSGRLLQRTEFGENFWEPIGEAINHNLRPYDSIVSISNVLCAIRDGTIDALPLFYEETVQKDS